MLKVKEKTCPSCGDPQTYRNRTQLLKAIRNKSICKKCSAKKTKSWKYSKHWNTHTYYLTSHPVWTKNCPRCGDPQYYKRRRHLMKMKKKNSVCRKCQLIIRKSTRAGDTCANYNPFACDYFNSINKEKGWNLQHALNGGEIKVLEYWVDAYDKDRNIVVEYDEPKHQYQKEYDEHRQRKIINHLHCRFFRYTEKEKRLIEVTYPIL